jgi:GT2 family glycosyltransferase
LIIVDDGSTSAALTTFLSEVTAWDDRIFVAHLPTNSGISAATNEALALARGEYIALVDHDDLVLPDALLAVVREINEEPAVDVIYTDQEYGSPDGAAEEPLVKPDWDPYLFLGVMYVGHLLVARRALAISVGGFDSNFDNVQDFEFMLRLSEHTDRIRHVPTIHYRWRRVAGSVATRGDAKADIESLQATAVSAHLRRRKLAAFARPHPHLAHRAQLTPASAKPLPLSLIVGPASNADATASTVRAYLSSAPLPLGVLLWGAEAEAATRLMSAQAIDVKAAQCLADAAACARGDMLLFLEPGLAPATEGWLEQLQFYAQLDDVACASGIVIDSAGVVDEAGLVIGIDGVVGPALAGRDADSDGYAGSLSCARTVSAVSGRSVMVERKLLVDLEGMNRHYSDPRLAWVDFSFRAVQRDLRCVVTPLARFILQERQPKPATSPSDLLLLRDRWGSHLGAGDPFHNPRFKLQTGGFTL